jgi:hypothetical protein
MLHIHLTLYRDKAMRPYRITLTNGDFFLVQALSLIHARQKAGRKLREGEEIAYVTVV